MRSILSFIFTLGLSALSSGDPYAPTCFCKKCGHYFHPAGGPHYLYCKESNVTDNNE